MRVHRLSAAISVFIIYSALFAHFATAQDSPGRFEVGGNLTAVHNPVLGSNMGPGIDGGVSFGRHVALDGSFNWLPDRPFQTFSGLFGAKIGTRREHFGFFGKVRPGFFTFTNAFRGGSFNQDTFETTTRRARLTQTGLDLGTVVEYYPASHWVMRLDLGDTMMFEENATPFTTIVGGVASTEILGHNQTTNHFTFSTAVHYRF